MKQAMTMILLCVVMFLGGCASSGKQYSSIIFTDGINEQEAIIIARKFLMTHPLKSNFYINKGEMFKNGSGVWGVRFMPRYAMGYAMRVDVNKVSGRIDRSGLIVIDRGTSFFDDIFNPLTEGDLAATQDYSYVASLVRYYQKYGRWPTDVTTLADYYASLNGKYGRLFNNLILIRQDAGVLRLTAVEPTGDNKFAPYLYEKPSEKEQYEITVEPQYGEGDRYLFEGPLFSFEVDMDGANPKMDVEKEFDKVFRQASRDRAQDVSIDLGR